MVGFVGGVLAVLLLVSFAALVSYCAVAGVAVVQTLRRARRDQQLIEDLDRVLTEILGPRTDSAPTPPTHRARRSRLT